MRAEKLKKVVQEPASRTDRFLNAVERAGNALPHPFILFMILAGAFMVLSWVLAKLGVSVPILSMSADGAFTETTVQPVNLLNVPYIVDLIVGFPQTFISFGPLKLSLVAITSIAVATESGMLSAFVRRVLLKASPTIILVAISFLGVHGTLFGDVGTLVLPPLSAALFAAMGFNPWLGLTLAVVGSTAGYSASLVITSTDINLAAITQTVVENAGMNAPTDPLTNWYFIAVSAILLTIVLVVVSKTVMKNKLPMIDPNANLSGGGSTLVADSSLTPEEKKGLRAAGIFSILYFGALIFMTVPKNGWLRSPEGTILPSSPFLSGLVMVISLYFLLGGVIFGLASKRLESIQKLPDLMETGVKSLAGFTVIIMGASIMLKVFTDSRIGDLIGAGGGMILRTFNIGAVPALLGLIVIAMLANLLIISGITKWLIFAPIFIPLLATLNVSPAAIQMAYRIGDATTNAISPMNAMLGIIIGFYALWKPKGYGRVGIGTVFTMAIPYTVAIGAVLVVQFLVWMLFRLPLGPGASLFL